MAEHARSPNRRALGRHALRSDLLAAQLVVDAGVGRNDLVWEIGAGGGRLTHALAHRADRVIAVEIDPWAADRLRRTFLGVDRVSVVTGDALGVPLPTVPFRAFGNVPFGATTALLRRLLDDPRSSLFAVDVVVQDGVARKRAAGRPSNLLSSSWSPWWVASIGRRLDPGDFAPPPSVGAALLSYRRRDPPSLPAGDRDGYVVLLRAAYAGGTVARSLRGYTAEGPLRAAARDLGIDLSRPASAVDVERWAELYRRCARRRPRSPHR